MRKKNPKIEPVEEIRGDVEFLVSHIDARFVEAAEERRRIEETLAEHSKILADHSDLLDKILFAVTGQEQRISGLEDRVRKIAAKIGLTLMP